MTHQEQQQQPDFFTSPAEMQTIAQQQQQSVQQQSVPALVMSPAQIKQLAHTQPSELIENFVPSGGTAVLAGAPGTGKSFTALSWAAAIAEGSEWFDQATRQAPVVYVLGEGVRLFGRRVEAWEMMNGRLMSEQVYFVDGKALGLDLKDGGTVQQLLELDVLAHVQPGLIIFDTFSALTTVSNENDNAEVAQVMSNMNKLVQATGTTALLIHHLTKSTGSVRGASAFVGNADTVVIAGKDTDTKAKPGDFLLSTDGYHGGKQRDSEPKTLHGFKITSPGVLDRDDATGTGQYNPNAVKDPNELMAKAMAVHESKKEQEKQEK